jgi:hypothetical protein
VNGAKRRNRRAREEQGYESSTPCCANCANYQRHQKQDPVPKEGPLPPTWKPFQVARCMLGDFPLQTGLGVCDSWRGRDGALLES